MQFIVHFSDKMARAVGIVSVSSFHLVMVVFCYKRFFKEQVHWRARCLAHNHTLAYPSARDIYWLRTAKAHCFSNMILAYFYAHKNMYGFNRPLGKKQQNLSSHKRAKYLPLSGRETKDVDAFYSWPDIYILYTIQ